MNLPARDDTTRVELAQQRLDAALSRLENALSNPVAPAPVPETSTQDVERLDELETEVVTLREANTLLEGANEVALTKVEATIQRLKSMLES